MADNSLKTLFNSAERQRLAIESSWDTNTEKYQEDVASALTAYQECRQLADRLALFSPNETLEDINSSDIQYLVIPYRIADLGQRLSTNTSDRKVILQEAKKCYEAFLTQLGYYEMLSTAEKKLYAEYQESPSTFSTISTTDPTARRNAKIANFKMEKELKKKLDFLAANPACLQNDEDAIRELEIAKLSLCSHNAFQSLESINRELEILAMAPVGPQVPQGQQSDDRERIGGLRGPDAGYSDRLDMRDITTNNKGPILSTGGKPLRPFTLLESRQALQKGVFRPGHNLPTMTIDEYLEEERARGGIIEGGGEASGIIPEIDPDDFEKMDEETEKARRWDEFTEDNPKGAGNTLNRG
ncbi:putative type 2a phosphatase-associated protein 42 protein [Botrytis fragariae]|uniref:Putative type 2a phosphatase-associated protein 42 protein n=1 Tax=Botrytis fragariae TaxID=1964551 RepID=A0A8H6EHU1_9HELO|nr:putative type 2a phosphatase-associated protein 42 protein [Botrytis fragariae]KAF5872731.1 putative type 2a phosphatase-associated protein 42 protein [Botrytis fragariae]